jgi:hypothetical protein
MCGWHCDRGMFSFVEGIFRWHNRVVAYALTLVVDQSPPYRLGHDPAPQQPGWTAADPAPLGARVAHVWHDDDPPADPGTVAASLVPVRRELAADGDRLALTSH